MTENADQMAPDASPGEVSKKAGVRRVNNMPMYILGGVLLTLAWVVRSVAVGVDETRAHAVALKARAGDVAREARGGYAPVTLSAA